jgi:hypothetical protein
MEKDACGNGVAPIFTTLLYYGCSISAPKFENYMFVVFSIPT